MTAAGEINNIEAFSRTSTALIGVTVENQLDGVLWRIARGDLQLWQVTPAIAGLVTFGYDQGRASLQPTIDRLNAECDRLYLRAHNSPEQIRAIQRRQMDAAAEQYWADFMAGRIELTDTTRNAA